MRVRNDGVSPTTHVIMFGGAAATSLVSRLPTLEPGRLLI